MKEMSRILLVMLAVLLSPVFLFSEVKSAAPSLMPMPAKVEFGNEKFRLNDSFTISIKSPGGSRLFAGASRALNRLAGRTGLFFKQDFITVASNSDSAGLLIGCNRNGQLVLSEDESYRLVVTSVQIKLEAETDIGGLRGLETFLQLLSVDDEGYFFPAVFIEDQPRFPWRGLMIDACRHFMPVVVLKRNLDGMAAVKMNVLHWHLSEDQGFRVECKTFPKLHQLGSDGFYYTQEQIKEVIRYAAEHGIRVVPEFDIPGHATSWLVAYPELASAPGPYQIERKWGVFDPTFNPTIEKTYDFFDKFFKEMSQLFPDEYMHIGGDENNGAQWDANPEIQAFKKAHQIPDNHALQSYFNQRILKILAKYDKKMIGWDEIFHPNMPTNIVIQSWRGRRAMVEAARKGYQTLLSNGYYIDLMQPTDYHYLNDPIPADSPLTEAEKKYILGGEATMWSEFVSPENVDSRIWPRTAAIAERFWSPGSVNDVADMYRRLEIVNFRLEELGLTHEKNRDMMLRWLTNNQEITALRNLLDVIEPVKEYQRNNLHEHTSFSPLTRVVDAARADAKIAREFRYLVTEYLSNSTPDSATFKTIRCWLQLWQANHGRLLPIIQSSPVLGEIETLSADLSQCAGIGLTALDFLQKQQRPTVDWLETASATVTQAKQPRGETELMILPAIEALLKKARSL